MTLDGAGALDPGAGDSSFALRAGGRIRRELGDARSFIRDAWHSNRLHRNRWFVIGDSHTLVLRKGRNVVLRMHSTTLHRMGQEGEAERVLTEALRWQETQHTLVGRVTDAIGKRLEFPMPTNCDAAVISYGEIDIRTHVHPQVFEKSRALDDVLDELAECATTLMSFYERNFSGTTAFLSLNPPVGEILNPAYPCPASIEQRSEWANDLNGRIANRVAKESYERVGFANCWDALARSDGTMAADMTFDYIHVDPKHASIVRNAIAETLGRLSALDATPNPE